MGDDMVVCISLHMPKLGLWSDRWMRMVGGNHKMCVGDFSVIFSDKRKGACLDPNGGGLG